MESALTGCVHVGMYVYIYTCVFISTIFSSDIARLTCVEEACTCASIMQCVRYLVGMQNSISVSC